MVVAELTVLRLETISPGLLMSTKTVFGQNLTMPQLATTMGFRAVAAGVSGARLAPRLPLARPEPGQRARAPRSNSGASNAHS